MNVASRGVSVYSLGAALLLAACASAPEPGQRDDVAALKRQVQRLEARLTYLEPPTGPDAEAVMARSVEQARQHIEEVRTRHRAGVVSKLGEIEAEQFVLQARARHLQSRDPWSSSTLEAIGQSHDELHAMAMAMLDAKKVMLDNGTVTQFEYEQALAEVERIGLDRIRLRRLRRDLAAIPASPTPAAAPATPR